MCGIYGLTGYKNNKNKLLKGLKKLEYRGYDSAGIAFLKNQKLQAIKTVGEIKVLEKEVEKSKVSFTCAIGHTRWATHGAPTKINAHPHFSNNKKFVLVHNGIIENFKELTKTYLKGVKLASQTDSEIIVQLIEKMFDGNVLNTFYKVCALIKGSYAFCLIYKNEPNKIYVTRKDSPLIVANKNKESFVASDVSALLSQSDEQYLLKNNHFAVLTPEKINFYDENLTAITYKTTKIHEKENETSKNGYSHFMLKEIFEIPKAILNTINTYNTPQKIYKIIPKKVFKGVKNIKIIACGTAYHAGLISKNLIEKHSNISVENYIASEFRYSESKLNKNTLCLFISQSGETADTLASLKKCKKLGLKTISITNVKNSSITYLADYNLYTYAGREIGVASTKAYNSQLTLLYLLSTLFYKKDAEKHFLNYVNNINKLSLNNTFLTKLENNAKLLAQKYKSLASIYLIGRQLDYDSSREASLKLKELTYINCEAYPAGELKHGTLSLIQPGTLVICFLTQSKVKDKTLNALFEVKSRGAQVLLITNQKNIPASTYDDKIFLEDLKDEFAPIISIIPIQLLTYYISLAKNINPDKPRNLAKAVTVE